MYTSSRRHVAVTHEAIRPNSVIPVNVGAMSYPRYGEDSNPEASTQGTVLPAVASLQPSSDPQESTPLIRNQRSRYAVQRRTGTFRVIRCLALSVLFLLVLGGVITAIVLGLIVLTHEAQIKDSKPVNSKTPHPWTSISGSTSFSAGQNSVPGIYQNAAVTSDIKECSDIGRHILQTDSASAVDVAIATLLCVGIHHPQNSGIGGGNVILIYERPRDGDEKELAVLDAREVAPLATKKDMFENGEKGLSVAVPGDIKGLYKAWKRFGRLSWRELLEPSIRLCRAGVVVGKALAESLRDNEEDIRNEPSLKLIFVKQDGKLLQEGDILEQPKLGDTLEAIAESGAGMFYAGDLADKIVKELQGFGGIVTKEDLSRYEVKWRTPHHTKIDNLQLRLVTAPPPFNGPIYQFILKLMDKYEPNALKNIASTDDQVLFYHRMIETFRFAYGLRTRLGDPDVTNLTQVLDGLGSPNFLELMKSKIDDEKTQKTAYYNPKYRPASQDGGGASHVSVLTQDGAAVSITSSISRNFGAKLRGQTTGIIYNSAMEDFAKPTDRITRKKPVPEVNLVAASKRPLSAMCPVLVFDENGNVVEVVGGSGGEELTATLAFESIHSLFLGQNIRNAVDRPRIYSTLIPNTVYQESMVSEDIVEGLRKKGHHLVTESRSSSVLVGIKNECVERDNDDWDDNDSGSDDSDEKEKRKKKKREKDNSSETELCITAVSDGRGDGAPSGY